MIHDKCWQIEISYQKDGGDVIIRDIPMTYHPKSLAAVFHHDFPSTNMDAVCIKFEEEENDILERRSFVKELSIDGIKVVFSKTCFKAIYDTSKVGVGVYLGHALLARTCDRDT